MSDNGRGRRHSRTCRSPSSRSPWHGRRYCGRIGSPARRAAMLAAIPNGVVYGGLLYIVSVGLVLIFGLRRIVNFAHRSLFMLRAYVGFSVAAMAGFWGAILAAAIALALVGAL